MDVGRSVGNPDRGETMPVYASQIIQTRDYRVVAGDVTLPVDLVFDQFDPRLGTLLDVEAVFQFTEQSASIDYENTGSSAAADIETGKVVNYVGPGLLSGPQTALFDSVELFRDQVNFGAFDGVFDFAGPDSFSFRQPTPAGHTLSATPTTFLPYVGTGTVPLEIVGVLGTSFGNPPNLRVRINGDELSGTVTYRYDFAAAAVPEPSTLALFSIGTLVWLGVTVLRRPGSCRS
jgi:hypothetical protein